MTTPRDTQLAPEEIRTLLAYDDDYYRGVMHGAACRRDDARMARLTRTGTQHANIRRGLFDSGNQHPIIPALAVAKWMSKDNDRHYDDMRIFFANDLSPLAVRQMLFHTWDRMPSPGEPEPSIVGYDCIVPPELDDDPMFPFQVIDPRFTNIYDGFDSSLFAHSYWPRDVTDLSQLQQARWDVSVITADDPDFWVFFATGGVVSRGIAPLFYKKQFTSRLYGWARLDKMAALDWVTKCSRPPELDKNTSRRAKQICNQVEKICRET